APEPLIGFAHNFPGFAHRHLPHQRQRESLEFFGEVFALPFPRNFDSVDMTAGRALAARHRTENFRFLAEDIQVSPGSRVGVIVASDRLTLASRFGTTLAGPEFLGLRNDDDKTIGLRFIIDTGYAPALTQTQQLMKDIFDNHEPTILPYLALSIPLEISTKPANSVFLAFAQAGRKRCPTQRLSRSSTFG